MAIKGQIGTSTGAVKKLIGVKNTTVETQYYARRAEEAVERRLKRNQPEKRDRKFISEELELEVAKTLQYGVLPLAHVAKKHNVSMSVIERIQGNLWVRKYDKQLGIKR